MISRKDYAFHFLVGIVLFLINLLIVLPGSYTVFSDQPWNNGQIYLAILRIFDRHSWTWNALHYCGAPLRFLYPPLLYVITILTARTTNVSPEHAFQVLTSLGYAVTPACLYVLAYQLFRQRATAIFAGLAYSLFPSAAYLSATWRNLAAGFGYAPWQFITFVNYQEAAHVFAFPIGLLAVTALWLNRRNWAFALTGLVCLTSWPAVIGLAFPFLGIASARSRAEGLSMSSLNAVSAGIIGYGLAAFWITPDYLISTSALRRVALNQVPIAPAPWAFTTWVLLAALAAVFLLPRWIGISPNLSLVLTWAAAAGAVVLAFTWEGSHIVPAPNRCMLELNAGCVLVISAGLSVMRRRHIVLAIAVGLGLYGGRGFIRNPWRFFPRPQKPESEVVYQVAQWLNTNAGRSRVFASGEVEETLPLWSDVPETGGTNQDIANLLPYAAQRYIALSCSANAFEVSKLWLAALNVRYVVVHGAHSREYYHLYSSPEKWQALRTVWTSGRDDWIYDSNEAGTSDAVIVDMNVLRELPAIRSIDDTAFLHRYVAWARGKRAVSVNWRSGDAGVLDANLSAGEGILVKSNYTRDWNARGYTITPDPIGFMLLTAHPGYNHLLLNFGSGWPQWVGWAIFLITISSLLLRLRPPWIAAVITIMTVSSYVYLTVTGPEMSIPESAYAQIEPPQINPGGIVNDKGGYDLVPGKLVGVYGLNFGKRGDSVSVWLDGENIPAIYHSTNLLQFRLPANVAASPAMSVSVNGCRGNEFALQLR